MRPAACVRVWHPTRAPREITPGLKLSNQARVSVGDLSGRLELAPQPRFSFFIEVQQAGVWTKARLPLPQT